MKKFKGFTLTELMVALAVIGILVAIVTPTIMKSRPNKNKMMIKKAYYTTENIVSSLINDPVLYQDMTDACRTGFVNPDASDTSIYCAYGFEWDEKVEHNGETLSGNNKFQQLFASKLNIASKDADMKIFSTTDGVKWDFTDIQSGWDDGKDKKPSDNKRILLIDVNGDEPPNCIEADCDSSDDVDRFRIEIQSNGKMNVHDADVKARGFVTVNSKVTN